MNRGLPFIKAMKNRIAFGVFLVSVALIYELYIPGQTQGTSVEHVAIVWSREIVPPVKTRTHIAIGYGITIYWTCDYCMLPTVSTLT